jgi:prepilin-type N-terminal cleavage/methylation domain-containing protein
MLPTRHPVGRERSRVRRGVTLLELMIALVATGLALIAARLLIEQVEDSGVVISRDAREEDAAANGERMLRILVGRSEVSPDSVRRFRGDDRTASFDSWCDHAAGWIERCRVTIAVGIGIDSSAVVASMSTGEVLHLVNVPGAAALRYASRDSAGVRWLESWGRSIAAPFALGIVFGVGDTVVVRIGERG